MASRHTEACRTRITRRLAAEEDPRALRELERIVQLGEQQMEEEHLEGGDKRDRNKNTKTCRSVALHMIGTQHGMTCQENR